MRMPPLKLTPITVLNLAGALVIVYLGVVLAQTVTHNYQMSRQIDELKAEMVRLQDQRDELAYNIQYYQTDSFKEKEARAKLGLQMPGEQVVILPKTNTGGNAASAVGEAPKKSNFGQWIEFLTGGR